MNKFIKKLLVFITLFTISINVYAIDPNNYITDETPTITQQEPQEEQIEDQEEPQEEIETIKVDEEINNHRLLIEDDAHLLTETEISKLKEKMEPLTEYGHIVFKTIADNQTSTQTFANNYYYSNFGNESGTIFIIDMDNRQIYIVSAGANYNVVTKRKAEIITDNIYRYASRQEYYECAYNAYDQIQTILDGGKIAEPMRHISNGVLAVVLAFFINFFIVLSASKIKKADKKELLKDCDIEFSISNVDGRKTGTKRVYSPVSSSSGGSSGGGGGGGGGGFSGGGGGHGF